MDRTFAILLLLAVLTCFVAPKVPTVTFTNGVKAPAIAFGTGTFWHKKESDKNINRTLVEAIKTAIHEGYYHIDTGDDYFTEKEVGIAIKESEVPREKLFITTKLDKFLSDPRKGLETSLKNLQLDYVDMYLIHSPFFNKTTHGIEIEQVWKIMESQYNQNLTRVIGVSNFRIKDIIRVLKIAKVHPEVNQLEFHPYVQSTDLQAFAKENKIFLQAYSPLAPIVYKKDGPVNESLQRIAENHKTTQAQVLLAWTEAKYNMVITTSGKKHHMKEALDSYDLRLSKSETNEIDSEGSKLLYREFWKDQFKNWP
ncbi:cpr-c2 [Acrasis kona]|uniref:Cpr-c2 n=1 Tax=Acrasis kona TaxID=1008807 RepID=A0AAW2YL36_9EUKA